MKRHMTNKYFSILISLLFCCQLSYSQHTLSMRSVKGLQSFDPRQNIEWKERGDILSTPPFWCKEVLTKEQYAVLDSIFSKYESVYVLYLQMCRDHPDMLPELLEIMKEDHAQWQKNVLHQTSFSIAPPRLYKISGTSPRDCKHTSFVIYTAMNEPEIKVMLDVFWSLDGDGKIAYLDQKLSISAPDGAKAMLHKDDTNDYDMSWIQSVEGHTIVGTVQCSLYYIDHFDGRETQEPIWLNFTTDLLEKSSE